MLLLLLGGCANYKVKRLPKLQPQEHMLTAEQHGVSFAYKFYTPTDCKNYLDRDVLAKGYQPIQITIINKSKHSLFFSLANISLAVVDASKVAPTVHTSTTGRVLGYGIPGLLIPVLWIPAIVDGLNSQDANKRLDEDFAAKCLTDCIIAPYETLNGLIFVRVKDCKKELSITLLDQSTNKQITLSADKTVVVLS